MDKIKKDIKKNGATFTPVELADFLAKKISSYNSKRKVNVLDPSCGDGALLLSLGKALELTGVDFALRGVDINCNYLESADRQLNNFFCRDKFEIQLADFLESISIENIQGELFDSVSSNMNQSADIIIANPPYVRTQLLGAEYSQTIAKKYGLKGKIDLYFPFLKAMTFALKEGGILGVITSNKYLNTKSGESVREFLKDNYEILEIIDLGDTKLFDAAVLPAIFIGKKNKSNKKNISHFFKIYEFFDKKKNIDLENMSVYDALNNSYEGTFIHNSTHYISTTGVVKFDSSDKSNWILLNEEEESFINRVERISSSRIRDHFKVKVGIKTTADKVFIREDWAKLAFEAPEFELIHELISQENINAWNVNETKLKILYPHFEKDGKRQKINLDKYPKAKKYLLSNYVVLSNRDYVIKSGRDWFEIWVPQNPGLWKFPKVVFPDISVEPRFCFDSDGRLVNGNCYWMVATKPEDVDNLLFIQGICNSRLMNNYHSLMYNNKLYSGRKRYFSQYIENYPLPRVSKTSFQEIVTTVKLLNRKDMTNKVDLENRLNGLINEAYGFSKDCF